MNMSEGQAKLEIGLLNAKTIDFDRLDLAVALTNKGLPQEIVTRLSSLSDYTRIIGGHVIQVGKIILMEVWKFVEKHPHLAIGMAVGAALGALTQLIPFIGPLIAPILTAFGAFLGALAGHRLDKREQGIQVEHGVIGIAEDLITLAKEFFQFFAAIINALAVYFSQQ